MDVEQTFNTVEPLKVVLVKRKDDKHLSYFDVQFSFQQTPIAVKWS